MGSWIWIKFATPNFENTPLNLVLHKDMFQSGFGALLQSGKNQEPKSEGDNSYKMAETSYELAEA